ncbi:MAG: CAP domain-containing protein [Acidobacteria bacterium]|nr:CAP domain-containing protein [Acidobacteriota bacterium]
MSYSIVLVVLVCASAFAQSNSPQTEQELLRLVNQERGARQMPPLARNPLLHGAALAHLREMIAGRKLEHQLPGEQPLEQRIATTGLRFQSSAENIASFTDRGDPALNAEQANSLLIHSPPHRENILNPAYNAAGIAVSADGREVWVVEDFARAFPEASTAEAERQAAQALDGVRRRKGLLSVKITPERKLQQMACRPETTPATVAREVSGQRSIDVFTTWDPQELPAATVNAMQRPELEAVSMGVCLLPGPDAHGKIRAVVVAY